MRLALVGNPNCGKSSLFNLLTGGRAKVANLPGVTVAPSRGRLNVNAEVELIDLPGTYSLHPKALDEAVTRDALLHPEQRPDGILLVLDSANIKRNLYLCLQALGLGLPTLTVVNETDETPWSSPALEQALRTEVFRIHALDGRGTEALAQRLSGWAQRPLQPARPPRLRLGGRRWTCPHWPRPCRTSHRPDSISS